jgi:hypothetical protein
MGRRYRGYSSSSATIQGNIYGVDVTVTVTEKDLMKILKKYLPENVHQNLLNELIDNPPVEDFTYELDTETDLNSVDMEVNCLDIEDCLEQIGCGDAKEICFRFLNDYGVYCNPKSYERIVMIPNLEAEREVELFLESYNKKWSL